MAKLLSFQRLWAAVGYTFLQRGLVTLLSE